MYTTSALRAGTHVVPVRHTGTTYRYDVTVCRTGTTYLYDVLVRCTGTSYRYDAPIRHTGTLCWYTTYRYVIPIRRTGTSYRYDIPLRRTGTTYRYVVPVRHAGTSYRYVVQVRRTGTSYRQLFVIQKALCIMILCRKQLAVQRVSCVGDTSDSQDVEVSLTDVNNDSVSQHSIAAAVTVVTSPSVDVTRTTQSATAASLPTRGTQRRRIKPRNNSENCKIINTW